MFKVLIKFVLFLNWRFAIAFPVSLNMEVKPKYKNRLVGWMNKALESLPKM